MYVIGLDVKKKNIEPLVLTTVTSGYSLKLTQVNL